VNQPLVRRFASSLLFLLIVLALTTAASKIPFIVSASFTGEHVMILGVWTKDSHGVAKSVFTPSDQVYVWYGMMNDGSVNLVTPISFEVTIYDQNNTPVAYAQQSWLGSPMSPGVAFANSMFYHEPGPLWAFPAGTYHVELIVVSYFLGKGGHYIPGGSATCNFTVT
jgi:hypothetical protein